jgi:acetoin utilization deacetylase AcuC-like enzyme
MTSPVTTAGYSSVMAKRRGGFDNDTVTTIWDERYCTTAAPTISTTKQAEVVRVAGAEGLLSVRPWPFNELRAWEAIGRVHDAAYVRAVRTGQPRALAECQGFRWSPAFANAAARIWAGHTVACRLALEEGLVFHPVSGAHHADQAGGGGFCTFNFLVGAGRLLLDAGELAKVAIVDLDAHQGDGTWRMVHGDDRFGVFDVAGSNRVGSEVTDRVMLHDVTDAAGYEAALAALPAFLDRFAPGLVQFQAGMDCHQDDPIGGIPGVDAAFLASRDRFVIEQVVQRRMPLVVNLAGGYQSDGTTVALHVETARIAAEVSARARRQRVRIA